MAAEKKVIGYQYISGNPTNVFSGPQFGCNNAILTTILILGSLEGHRSRDHRNTIYNIHVLAKSAKLDLFWIK